MCIGGGSRPLFRSRFNTRGEIVNKTVLQSLGPKLDEKVFVALNDWHFHPATRNDAPIPSKQDAIFHFRARG
jgi:hypothetical protein